VEGHPQEEDPRRGPASQASCGRDCIGCTELRTAEKSPLCVLYLDHGLAQDLRKWLPREAAGSIAGRDDANHPGSPSASKHGLPAQAECSKSGPRKEGQQQGRMATGRGATRREGRHSHAARTSSAELGIAAVGSGGPIYKSKQPASVRTLNAGKIAELSSCDLISLVPIELSNCIRISSFR
jgi:hypothetical protein